MRTPIRVLSAGAAATCALALVLTGCSSDTEADPMEATAASATGDPGGHATAEAEAPPAVGVTDEDIEAAEDLVAQMSDEEIGRASCRERV